MLSDRDSEKLKALSTNLTRILYGCFLVFLAGLSVASFCYCNCSKLAYAMVDHEEKTLHCKAYFYAVGDHHTGDKMCINDEFMHAWVHAYDLTIGDMEEEHEGLVSLRDFEYHCSYWTFWSCVGCYVGQRVVVPLVFVVVLRVGIFFKLGVAVSHKNH